MVRENGVFRDAKDAQDLVLVFSCISKARSSMRATLRRI